MLLTIVLGPVVESISRNPWIVLEFAEVLVLHLSST